MAPFDRVVLSYNDDPRYAQFVPLVIHAWKRFFSEVEVYASSVVPPAGMPSANMAKIARYYSAAHAEGRVCLIHDVDTVPLQRDYYVRLTEQRLPGHLLCVGAEVYLGTPHEGKFPAGCLTGEGHLFRRLMPGPGALGELRVFDHKENPFTSPAVFSDESMLRALLHTADVPVQHVERGVDIYCDWVDRSWWHLLDIDKLNRGEYVECNLLRPWSENREAIQPIVDFLEYKGPIP